MGSHKQTAQEFLTMCARGYSRAAFARFVAKGFRHHNPYFRGDGETLMLAMEESARKNPDKIFEIHRALEEGDLVAVHSRVTQNPGELGAAVIHIFRFEGNKIAELWDFGQAVPEETVNENGMF